MRAPTDRARVAGDRRRLSPVLEPAWMLPEDVTSDLLKKVFQARSLWFLRTPPAQTSVCPAALKMLLARLPFLLPPRAPPAGRCRPSSPRPPGGAGAGVRRSGSLSPGASQHSQRSICKPPAAGRHTATAWSRGGMLTQRQATGRAACLLAEPRGAADCFRFVLSAPWSQPCGWSREARSGCCISSPPSPTVSGSDAASAPGPGTPRAALQ